MLGIKIVPRSTSYDAASALPGAISTTPIVLPEPSIEIPEIEMADTTVVGSTTKSNEKPVKYKGEHAALDNNEMEELVAAVKAMTLDANLLDPIRKHMLEYLSDLQTEMRERKITEAEKE